ncbi:MAG: 6-hydroxymethylpterin diphosphokinase MptE-like protein [Breznakiellaceae bacterium]
MNDRNIFERNMLALSAKNPLLCQRLSRANPQKGMYIFERARNGSPVPLWALHTEKPVPLHSLIDPDREGERLIETSFAGREGSLIFLGLGGGYALRSAISRSTIHHITIIDFHIDGVAELFSHIDYVPILTDPRVDLLIDPDKKEVQEYLISTYSPVFWGNLNILSLRNRYHSEETLFSELQRWISEGLERVGEDFSVQALFGKRWFSNIIRNMLFSSPETTPLPPVRNVAITAAGPSLEKHLTSLKKNRRDFFLLATDTSLSALLLSNIVPDGVVSIDCQHISYHHFLKGIPDRVFLFADLASPPSVVQRSRHTYFFAGGHPLTRYLVQWWRSFPVVDTSGGNVTYAAVSLAEQLGARSIRLYGADFSYPEGKTYARGTYVYDVFQEKQSRLAPLESILSAFLFRSPSLEKKVDSRGWRYETKPLTTYRLRLERLAQHLSVPITASEGDGSPLTLPSLSSPVTSNTLSVFGPGRQALSARDFLSEYSEKIRRLPSPKGIPFGKYLAQRSGEELGILMTLAPLAAALRHRQKELSLWELFEMVVTRALTEIEQFL